MSRCEPAPEYRGKDGWHWVQAPVGSPHLARWDASENPSVEALWTSSHHVYSGTPRYVVNEWGWRYLEPVATPDEVAALRGEVARLREVLKPFAAMAKHFPTVRTFGTRPTTGPVYSVATIDDVCEITAEDLRAAAAALNEGNGK